MGKKRILVITGVPCTGKTMLAKLLKLRLSDAEVIHTTDLISEKKLFSSRAKDGARIVRMTVLGKAIQKIISESRSRTVILEGHILCDLPVRGAKAVVLREHLDILLDRMRKRGYGKEKIKSNLVSEATDYCGAHAEENYREVYELFAGRKDTIAKIVQILNGRKPKAETIDLLKELPRMIEKDKDLVI